MLIGTGCKPKKSAFSFSINSASGMYLILLSILTNEPHSLYCGLVKSEGLS
jgi:hypothetical protein